MDFFFFTSDYTDKVPPDTLVSKFDSELTLSTILVYRNREKICNKRKYFFSAKADESGVQST